MNILVDQIGNVALTNGTVRIQLMQVGFGNQPVEVGTLIIPAARAGQVSASLGLALKQLDEKLRSRTDDARVDGAAGAI